MIRHPAAMFQRTGAQVGGTESPTDPKIVKHSPLWHDGLADDDVVERVRRELARKELLHELHAGGVPDAQSG